MFGANGICPRPELRPSSQVYSPQSGWSRCGSLPTVLVGWGCRQNTRFEDCPSLPQQPKSPKSTEQHPGTHEGKGGEEAISLGRLIVQYGEASLTWINWLATVSPYVPKTSPLRLLHSWFPSLPIWLACVPDSGLSGWECRGRGSRGSLRCSICQALDLVF